jgi:hypothetical protein
MLPITPHPLGSHKIWKNQSDLVDEDTPEA